MTFRLNFDDHFISFWHMICLYSNMKFNLISAKYILFILIGVLILVTIIIGENKYQDLKLQLVQQEKDSIKQVIESDLNEKTNKFKLIGTSIRGFYEGSQLVEPHEFAQFNEGIFENVPELKNIFVVQGSKIIHSYPNSDFIGSDFDVLFPSIPDEIEGIMVGMLEFPINQELSTVLAIPFDYVVNEDNIPKDRFKLIVYTLNRDLILYQAESNNKQVLKQNVKFSQEQLENSIQIIKQTNLVGYHSKENLVLEYILWYDTLQQEFSTYESVIIFAGIFFSALIPILLIRSQKLSSLLQKNAIKLESANMQLQEVDKAKNEFSSMITHELKSPIFPIIGYCKMLKKDGMIGHLNEEQLKAVETIERNINGLERLIGDILDVNKLEMKKLKFVIEEFPLDEFITDLDSSCKSVIEQKGIELVIDSTNIQGLVIKSDRTRLRQVFDNLINNSAKFVNEQGGKIEASAKKEDHQILFYVKDNGIGIPKDKQKDLFKKFYQIDSTLERKSVGSGLGLAICKAMMEKLGGKIWVESQEGNGSTFYFTLPYTP